MPTIKVVTRHGESLYEADRVIRDSRVHVLEARRDCAWVPVATISSAAVTSVQRLIPGTAPAQWLVEDVRTVAGVGHGVEAVVPPATGRSGIGRRVAALGFRRRGGPRPSREPSQHTAAGGRGEDDMEMRERQ